MDDQKIYTLNEAVEIVELFEDLLQEHNIKLPSPEDDERGDDNEVSLYGSVYSELVDEIECRIIDILDRAKNGQDYVYGILNEPFKNKEEKKND